MIRLLPIDAAGYRASPLHADDRVWVETNCYVDLWIELLHSLGLDPTPGLAFTLSVDFEGDQWQFFKYPLDDLRRLYGLDVAEMNPWRGLEHHVYEQLEMGRFLTAEVDSWYLPDTTGVSYEIEHVKTSIVVNMMDREQRRLGYWHGPSYYELEGDDYSGIFGHGVDRPEILPPYVELVKLDGMHKADDAEMVDTALALLRVHLARRPASNPVQRFRKRLDQDMDWLLADGIDIFHYYAFSTVRQFGSAVELTGSFCDWLAARGEPTAAAGAQFLELSELTKTAQFKLARKVSGRNIDLGPVFDSMELAWDTAMQGLVEHYG